MAGCEIVHRLQHCLAWLQFRWQMTSMHVSIIMPRLEQGETSLSIVLQVHCMNIHVTSTVRRQSQTVCACNIKQSSVQYPASLWPPPSKAHDPYLHALP